MCRPMPQIIHKKKTRKRKHHIMSSEKGTLLFQLSSDTFYENGRMKKISILVGLLGVGIFYLFSSSLFSFVYDLGSSVMEDALVKGAFVMSIVYALKDYMFEFGSFMWQVTVGASMFKSLTITTSDADNKPLYNKVCFWLMRNFTTRIASQRVNVENKEYVWLDDLNANTESTIDYHPGEGLFLIKFKDTFVWIDVSVSQLNHGTGWDNKPQSVSSVTFKVFGWNERILADIVNVASEFYEKNKSYDKTSIRQGSPWYPQGRFLISKDKVDDLRFIVLADDVEKRVLKILNNFKNHPEIWKDQNLSHRESILLYGPPGNGKTMLINFIAGYLGYDILLLNLTSSNIDDEDLLQIFSKASPKTVIVIEEIDAACPQRDLKKDASSSRRNRSITMSGLLLALDGPANKDGPLLVATTNCYEKLDAALTRAGRFNHHIKLTWATEQQLERLLHDYFPEATDSETQDFITALYKKNISCATIVGFLRQCKLDIENNITAADVVELAKTIKSGKDVGGTRLNLASDLGMYLREMDVRPVIVEEILKSGLVNIRDFKGSDFSDITSLFDQGTKIPFLEKAYFTKAHEDITEIYDKIKELENSLIEKQKEELKKLRKKEKEAQKATEANDENNEGNDEKDDKDENDDEDDDENDEIEDIAKELEEVKEKFSVPLEVLLTEKYHISVGVIEKLKAEGITTQEQFKICDDTELIELVEKHVIELSLKDKVILSVAHTAASESIEEEDVFQDVDAK
eukprot:TRINITY_DN12982_c0_g1_i1.p1 TRINITY_DN12982_c0_g1~~TRINITY_DN12982_c0_g1_i1.p1  ORF type:complete len:746 (+),score=180.50 TRINITY_DN12982_c0_g1_i1:112-2349(+)